MGEPIVISEYDPHWPELFRELRDRLPAGLRMRARSIEHIGSTAVPGLAAKPIIDIDVVVADRADVAEAIAMLADGRLPAQGRRRRARARPPSTSRRTCPSTTCTCAWRAAAPLVAHLRLRDHLRANPGTAREYAALKRELAAAYGDDRAGYTEAKTAFIETVLAGG